MQGATKKQVRQSVVRAKKMLERNADSCETFEGVLNPGYARALRILVVVAEEFLSTQRRSIRRPI